MKIIKGIAGQIKSGIEGGKSLTVREWAEELNCTEPDIRRALTRLRQTYGFHQFHPIGTKSGRNPQQGEIKDIMLEKEWVVETMDRQKLMYKDPQLVAFADWMHKSYLKFPELKQQFKVFLTDELAQLMILDKELKK